jgi:hypothetical protein
MEAVAGAVPQLSDIAATRAGRALALRTPADSVDVQSMRAEFAALLSNRPAKPRTVT